LFIVPTMATLVCGFNDIQRIENPTGKLFKYCFPNSWQNLMWVDRKVTALSRRKVERQRTKSQKDRPDWHSTTITDFACSLACIDLAQVQNRQRANDIRNCEPLQV
jgi:hypothetical protein